MKLIDTQAMQKKTLPFFAYTWGWGNHAPSSSIKSKGGHKRCY